MNDETIFLKTKNNIIIEFLFFLSIRRENVWTRRSADKPVRFITGSLAKPNAYSARK